MQWGSECSGEAAYDTSEAKWRNSTCYFPIQMNSSVVTGPTRQPAIVPADIAAEYEARQRRFCFLFPPELNPRSPGFHLIRPDLLELRWSVVERLTNRTVAYGATAEQAVDTAIAVVSSEQRARDGVEWTDGELWSYDRNKTTAA